MAAITIELAPDTERKLRESAAREGQSLETYLVRIAEQAAGANGATPPAPRRASFEELTGPIANAVAAAGATDEEVEELFEEVVKDVRAGRRPGSHSPP